MVTLSLVVPVYNMESLLPRCMTTLLSQSEQNFEIILVNDGSTDCSGQLCDTYASQNSSFVRVIHKKNGGLSSARNAGMDVAKGSFVCFPDPDDWVDSSYVEHFVQLQRTYHADLVCTGYYIDYDDRQFPSSNTSTRSVLTRRSALEWLLRPAGMGGFAWNKIYRLDIIRKNNLRFADDVGTTEDLDFAFRYLSFCSSIVWDPQIRTYHYYQREGAATRSSFSSRKLESLRTYQHVIDNFSSAHPELIVLAKDVLCVAAVQLVYLAQSSSSDETDAVRYLRKQIFSTLPTHLRSPYYGVRYKIQSIFALLFPALYTKIKQLHRLHTV